MTHERSADPRPKRQHYVPQFLLRYFCEEDPNRLWVFDKHTDKIWQQGADQVGHEKYYNEAPIGGGWVASYEARFERIESGSAPVLAKLNAGTPTRALSVPAFAQLCYFVAVQYLWTPAYLSMQKHFNEMIRDLFPDGDMPETIRR